MAKINDFGEKIGGARKDAWKLNGIKITDLSDMTSVEKDTYVKKDNVWPKPDWVKLVADGTPQVVAFWQNEMRKAIPPKPPKTTDEGIENYVKIVSELKDAIMAVKTEEELANFYPDVIKQNYASDYSSYYISIKYEANGIITNKVLRAAQQRVHNLRNKAEETLFGIPEDKKTYVRIKNSLNIYKYDNENVKFNLDGRVPCLNVRSGWGTSYYYFYNGDKFADPNEWQPGTYFVMDKNMRKPVSINLESREKAEVLIEALAEKMQEKANLNKEENKDKNSGTKRKGAFVPPQLSHIKRDGPEYRNSSATGDMYMEELKFRAGEFGNWMDENDRQTSLDMGYDALRDLARVLNIKPEDVSLGGNLAIAFGARGTGGANAGAAHYEPLRQVINLTKMSGAGCLAHEWGHALDHAIGLSLGSTKMASEATRLSLPESFKDVLKAMKYKEKQVDLEEMRKALEPKIKNAKRQLTNWTDSVRPRGLTDAQKEKWDTLVNQIIDNAESFSGFEYQRVFGQEPEPNPYVEALSMFRKNYTNHVIPKDTKIQLALWARNIKKHQKEYNNVTPKMRMVETDFYVGSGEFDKAYSKSRHGYWQSTCEMFARAFDCYISDKLKEGGYKSEYLTAHADSYVISDGKGGTYAAIPLGEERKVINEKFDLLIQDLKERGLLHHFVEEVKSQEIPEPEFDWSGCEPKPRRRKSFDDNPYDGKQLSFADLIADASARAEESNRGKTLSQQQEQLR